MFVRAKGQRRRGNILPLMAICLVLLFGMVALAVDIGMLAIARNQCQSAADAAALAGCRTINGNSDSNYNVDAAPGAAIQAAAANKVMGAYIQGDANTNWNPSDPAEKAKVHPQDHIYKTGQVTVEVGAYAYSYDDANPNNEGFKLQMPRTDVNEPYSAVRVTVDYQGSYFFGRVFGFSAFDTGATAVAVHRPRDVVIIMDLSGSMRFQSLPGGPYYGARSFSMNPEDVYPQFGHYTDKSAAGLKGNSSKATGSGEYYDPANLTITSNSGPPILEYFFQNAAGEMPSAANRAFKRSPDSYQTAPGGDNCLKKKKNTDANYAQTANDVTEKDLDEVLYFERQGYDHYLGDGGFKGYTEGPGYWGKTFFIWPPDPRGADPAKSAANAADHVDNGAKDWRQRFFIKKNVNNGQLGWLDHNSILWQSTANAGRMHAPNRTQSQVTVTENGVSRTYVYLPNYAAILKWLDTDPKPFPPRLRAGRIKYYDAFPNYNDSSLNSRWWTTDTDSLPDLNERFWKGYIDFVLGFMWRPGAGYSNTVNNTPNSGTWVESVIGNGGTFVWGVRKIGQKPVPLPPNQTAAVSNSGGYAAGHTDWIKLASLSVPSAPATGDFVRFGSDSTVYKITAVQNFNAGAATVEIKTDIGLAADAANGASVKLHNRAKGYPTPYMDYDDNPRRPRHHFWFGPMTLVDHIGNYNTNQFWWPGNVPEAQAWACKIGIQTAIDDIKNNHPNDFVGMTFFSNPKYSRTDDGQHNQAIVPLGRNYQMLKDSLWFPATTITGGDTEIHPWHPAFDQVPRAKGGTAPGMGFMIAYNLLSSSNTNLRSYAEPQPQYRGVAGGLGRKGAARLVIFETDGAPNTRAYAALAGTGGDSYYPIRVKVPNNLKDSKNVEWPKSGTYSNAEVIDVVKQICALTTANPPGFSTARKKVQVYCIGYGTLFDPANASDPDQSAALDFFQEIQYWGNTSTSLKGSDFPDFQRIYGTNAERIARMQKAFTTIMQGGVQVTLIE